VRVIYFAMLPTGALNDTNVVVYVILGDLPVYLFLSIYTLLLFFWYDYHHRRRAGRRVVVFFVEARP
jgi:hypothetical protein